jgi:hypothetical protein
MTLSDNNLIPESVGFVAFLITFYELITRDWSLGLSLLIGSSVYLVAIILVNLFLLKWK